MMNHYDWLRENLPHILDNLSINPSWSEGLITGHGDKCDGYKERWEQHGIPFPHGVAYYLLTRIEPWSEEVRQTKDGWVDPGEWVLDNYNRFEIILPEVS